MSKNPIGSQSYWNKRGPWIANKIYEEQEKAINEFIKDNMKLLDKLTYDLYKYANNIKFADIRKLSESAEFKQKILDIKKELSNLSKKERTWIERQLINSTEQAVKTTAKDLGIDFNISRNEIKEVINADWVGDGSNWSARVWGNKQALIDSLNTSLKKGIVQGLSIKSLVDKINKDIPKASRARLYALVRTETMHAVNEAQSLTYAKAGITRVKILVTGDERLCPHCSDLDGTILPVDSTDKPPFHPRCRCTIVPDMSSYKSPSSQYGKTGSNSSSKGTDESTKGNTQLNNKKPSTEPLGPKKGMSIGDMNKNQLISYAKSNLGLDFSSTLDDKALRSWIQWNDDFLNKYPKLKEHMLKNPVTVGVDKIKGSIGGYHTIGTKNIFLNRDLFTQGAEEVTNLYNIGSRGYTSFYSLTELHINRVFVHEYGHMIQGCLLELEGKKVTTPAYKKYAKELRSQIVKEINADWDSGFRSDITYRTFGDGTHLSAYAGTNAEEAFAEGFVEAFSSNPRQTRPLAKKYKELIERVIK